MSVEVEEALKRRLHLPSRRLSRPRFWGRFRPRLHPPLPPLPPSPHLPPLPLPHRYRDGPETEVKRTASREMGQEAAEYPDSEVRSGPDPA